MRLNDCCNADTQKNVSYLQREDNLSQICIKGFGFGVGLKGQWLKYWLGKHGQQSVNPGNQVKFRS